MEKIQAATLGETVSASSNVVAYPEHVASLCLGELYEALDWKEAFLTVFPSSSFFLSFHRNGEELKLGREAAGMKIPSTEDRRAGNKLPTDD